jgi:hypothetical protein
MARESSGASVPQSRGAAALKECAAGAANRTSTCPFPARPRTVRHRQSFAVLRNSCGIAQRAAGAQKEERESCRTLRACTRSAWTRSPAQDSCSCDSAHQASFSRTRPSCTETDLPGSSASATAQRSSGMVTTATTSRCHSRRSRSRRRASLPPPCVRLPEPLPAGLGWRLEPTWDGVNAIIRSGDHL